MWDAGTRCSRRRSRPCRGRSCEEPGKDTAELVFFSRVRGRDGGGGVWQGVPRVRSGRPSRGFRLGPGVPVRLPGPLRFCRVCVSSRVLGARTPRPCVLVRGFLTWPRGRGRVQNEEQGSRAGLPPGAPRRPRPAR